MRLVLKTVLLLVSFNLLFALVNPIQLLGKLSMYNTVFPGRIRLPYGDDPSLSFNLTLNQIDAMFASHIIAQEKPDREFRVLLVGDSSVWGFLQEPNHTLAAQLNLIGLRTNDGREAHFYNLGYPTLSLIKDLLILDYADQYQPDLILWFITLEAMPVKKQLDSPLLQYHPDETLTLLEEYGLRTLYDTEVFQSTNFWDRTIIGRRRVLADLFRHQIYGVLWSATGVDQYIPETYEQRSEDLTADLDFQGLSPDQFDSSTLAFNVIRAGIEASTAPVLLINEPIFVSTGENSDVRYNFYYPRWAYDEYRSLLAAEVSRQGWELIDLWDALPGEAFTDSAIHYDLEGVRQVTSYLLSSPQFYHMAQ